MKYKLFSLVLFIGVLNATAQTNYTVTYTTNGGNPGGINIDNDDITAGWTIIINPSISVNQWSIPVQLPFAFSYFGHSVNAFKASANGLVTFDTGTVVLPGQNTNLPSNVLPYSTIACFWDDFTSAPPTAANDYVVYKTWGTAPNRQLWIKWVSFEIGAPPVSNSTFACVLEESTNKIYLVESYATTTPVQTVTTGLQLNALRAVQHGNSFKPLTTNTSSTLTTDNDYYTFTPYVQASMTYVSGTTAQPITEPVANNSLNEGILRIEIETSGELNPISANGFAFNTNGSSTYSNITNAKLFYTGNDSALKITNQFGNTAILSGNIFSINGNVTLLPGKNYFWLTYSIANGAPQGDSIDAQCTQITIGSTPQIPTVTAPTGNRKITTGLSGTITVGNGGTYTYLSDAIKDINTKRLSNNLMLSIVSDINDTASATLNYSCPTPYKISIRPSADTIRHITCRQNDFYLNFNGVSNLVINGNSLTSGSGRYLQFLNKDSLGGIFNFINGSKFDSLANILIEGTCISQTKGVITFGESVASASGIQNITIYNNIMRDRSDSLSIPAIFIYSSATTELPNQANNIINNEIYNFRRSGIYINTIGNGGLWKISGNHFYYNAPIVASIGDLVPIMFIPGINSNANTITNNYIGGSAPNCGGTAWQSPNAINWVAMNINSGLVVGTSIQGNTIQNINMSTTATVDFVGIRIESGKVNIGDIAGNTIGHSSTTNSIVNAARLTLCIYAFTSNLGDMIIENNTIANVSGTGTASTAGVRGISIQQGAGHPFIINNTIHHLSAASANTNALTTCVMGIGLNSGGMKGIITRNTIYNIAAVHATANTVPTGIVIDNSDRLGMVQGNKIYNITNASSGASALISGIHIAGGVKKWDFRNNFIALTNSPNSNNILIRGVSDNNAQNEFNLYNNTIYIGGSITSGAINSFAYDRRNTSTVSVINNILYNERTGGTGIHAAFGQSSTVVNWSRKSSNYNLLIARNRSSVMSWGGSPVAYSFADWKTISIGNDWNSWSDTIANIPSDSFFRNKATGDLFIDTTKSFCWYANGKGLALRFFDKDIIGNYRSSSIATGGIDIGAHEFNTTTQPIPAIVSGNIQYSDSSLFTFAERRIAKIIWNSGTLPSSVSLQYYSGSNPPAVVNGTNFFNAYHQFTQSGASMLDADVIIAYDSALLGTISSQTAMIMAHKSGSNWGFDILSTKDTVVNYLRSNNVSNLEIFTGTDLLSPLPIQLNSFKAISKNQDAIIEWQTASERNVRNFELLAATDGKNFTTLATINAKGNSPGTINYAYQHKGIFETTNKMYYQLKTVDYNGTFTLSDIVFLQVNTDKVNSISVYPNPFQNNLQVQIIPETPVSVEILTSSGISVYSIKTVSDAYGKLTLEGLNTIPVGVYFLKILGANEIYTQKLIKQ